VEEEGPRDRERRRSWDLSVARLLLFYGSREVEELNDNQRRNYL